MRILIDGATWANVRGFGRVTREIVRAMLAAAPPSIRFAMLVDPATRQRADFPPGLEIVEAKVDVAPGEAASAAGARSIKDLFRFRKVAAAHDPDILFFPAVYTYFPVRGDAKVAIIFHDTIAESLPKHIFPSWKNRLFWNLKCRAAARRADLVVTVSEASRRALETAYDLSKTPVAVVSWGFDRRVFHPRRSDTDEPAERAALRIGPKTQVILAVGGLSPHKNLERLILALAAMVSRDPQRDVKLVLVGADRGEDVFFSSRDRLQALVDQHRLGTRVVFTGFVSDERLGALYRLATVLAFPSLLEGFGLPALEAMACGTAVAASTRGSLPEVLGDAGIYFDAESTDDVVRALGLVLDDGAARARAVAAGLAISEAFSWEAAGRRLLAEFEKLSEPTA